ncbi:MAG: sigma-54 dependent transcriptional regulator [Proteobacteria bacterium]|nr:sigma-54 dependent transcriptional regulator [Pseudomonadota bacterium]
MSYVLLIDDDDAFRAMLAETLRALGLTVRDAPSAEAAFRDLDDPPTLAFVDLRIDGDDEAGLEILLALRERFAQLPVVMLTAYGEVTTAVAAMKAGALDFIEKPVNLERIRALAQSFFAPDDDPNEAPPLLFGGIFPGDPPMREATALLHAAAATESPVLITGESGTGKELAAAFIHENSPRKDGPFVCVNCSAIPEALVESEMFGNVAGAFTGALKAREGRFAAAHGGTLFLDEIGEMALPLQAKLLRVLQEKTFEPVGSNKSRQVDVRIVAATNRPLLEALEGAQLREDLYYRISVFHVHLPPLRERPADILPLALQLLSQTGGARPVSLSPEAADMLRQHPWPGNIRELANAMERARFLARGGTIRPTHLPFAPAPAAVALPPHVPQAPVVPLLQMEQQLIANALRETDGNRTEAAKRLGMSRRALLYKLKRYGLS